MSLNKKAIIVSGSRYWYDRARIEQVLRKRTDPGDMIIHGGQVGADMHCHVVARRLQLRRVVIPYYDHMGKAGGIIRNKDIVTIVKGLMAIGWEVECIAFHDNILASKGTLDMCKRVLKAGIPLSLYTVGEKVKVKKLLRENSLI